MTIKPGSLVRSSKTIRAGRQIVPPGTIMTAVRLEAGKVVVRLDDQSLCRIGGSLLEPVDERQPNSAETGVSATADRDGTNFKDAVVRRLREEMQSGAAFDYVCPTQTSEWWQVRTYEGQWLRFIESSSSWVPQAEPASEHVQKSGACWFQVGPDVWARWNPAKGTAEESARPPLDPILDHVRTITTKIALYVAQRHLQKDDHFELSDLEAQATSELILNQVSQEFGLGESEAAKLIVKSQQGNDWDEGSPLSFIAAIAR